MGSRIQVKSWVMIYQRIAKVQPHFLLGGFAINSLNDSGHIVCPSKILWLTFGSKPLKMICTKFTGERISALGLVSKKVGF